MKKKLLVLLCIMFLSWNIFSETNTTKADLSHYIGAGAGMSTGYGLSYRYWPGDWGTQIILTPIASDSNILINLGTAALKTLIETKYTTLFLYIAGNGTYLNGEEIIYIDSIDDEPMSEPTSENVTNLSFSVGVGPGIEIYLFKYITLNIMFGYRYAWGDANIDGLGFTVETALYYRF